MIWKPRGMNMKRVVAYTVGAAVLITATAAMAAFAAPTLLSQVGQGYIERILIFAAEIGPPT